MLPKRYDEIRILIRRVNKFIWFFFLLGALCLSAIYGIVHAIECLVAIFVLVLIIKPLERWIEERELEIEWLRLKIEYMEDPVSFLKKDVLNQTVYLNDCYEGNGELIMDISKYSVIPNDRYNKFLQKDWFYRFSVYVFNRFGG